MNHKASAPPQAGHWHRRVGGLHVIKVKGSDYEMGFQHGSLLRDEVRQGPLPYYRTYMEQTLGRTGLGSLAPLIFPAIRQLLGRQVALAMPPSTLATLRGLADGAGIPFAEIMDGATMPDSFLWLASKAMRLKRLGPAMHHRLALGLGCTSAIAWDQATADGRLLHARNTDYHGVACWPRTTTVTFHEPDEGQRFASVGAAGIPLGGFTAMNEAGLSMVVHQHMFTDRTAFGGIPICVVGDLIMRRAETLTDARKILAEHRPIGCWTYLIADAHRRELLCWEENPERNRAIEVPRAKQTFGYANIYLDEALGASEVNLYGSYWRHNHGRQKRATQLLERRTTPHDPESMARILADPGDPECRIRNSIAMLMTVGSMVFRPEDGVFWVASGEAPTSQGTYLPFDLSQESPAPEHGSLNPTQGSESPARQAFECYRLAYLAAVDGGDWSGGLRHLDRAVEHQPQQPLYQFLRALLNLKRETPEAASLALDRAIALGHPDSERRAGFHLWRARANDLRGRRTEALRDYRASLGHHADPPVRRAALRGLRRRFRPAQARRIDVDFTFADVISP